MAKFLTDEDFLEIRTAINDTVETFAQKPVVYNLSPKQTLSRMGIDKHNEDNKTEFNLLGLVVWNAPESEIDTETLGKFDFSMGYVLFSWDYLEAEGLAETLGAYYKLKLLPEKDTIKIDDEVLEVKGVVIQGQLKDKECVVKVFFKRNLKNG